MNRVIIDTNIFVALIDEKDKWHMQARIISNVLKEKKSELIFFDCVINEAVTVMGRRLEEKGLSKNFPGLLSKLETLISEEEITWISPKIKRLYSNIMKLVAKHNGRLNFHDALIALVSREVGIKYIASFDNDFDHIDWLIRIKNKEKP